MKKLALISTYCNSWEKLNTLYNTLIKLKELNIDSLVYSPLPLPKEIVDTANFIFTTKENPIIYYPERGLTHYTNIDKYIITLVVPDYGWASIYQYKKLMEIGSSFDYDYYFPLIYDLNIDNEVEKILKFPHDKLFFPSDKASRVKTGGIFISLNKENLNYIHPLINKSDYKSVCNNNIAEKYIEYLCESINGSVSPHITTDTIYEHGNLKFNILPDTYPFKLAIDNTKFNFLFYDMVNTTEDITFEINNLFYDITPTHQNYFFEFSNIKNIDKINLYYKQKPLNITHHFTNSKDLLRLLKTS